MKSYPKKRQRLRISIDQNKVNTSLFSFAEGVFFVSEMKEKGFFGNRTQRPCPPPKCSVSTPCLPPSSGTTPNPGLLTRRLSSVPSEKRKREEHGKATGGGEFLEWNRSIDFSWYGGPRNQGITEKELGELIQKTDYMVPNDFKLLEPCFDAHDGVKGAQVVLTWVGKSRKESTASDIFVLRSERKKWLEKKAKTDDDDEWNEAKRKLAEIEQKMKESGNPKVKYREIVQKSFVRSVPTLKGVYQFSETVTDKKRVLENGEIVMMGKVEFAAC